MLSTKDNYFSIRSAMLGLSLVRVVLKQLFAVVTLFVISNDAFGLPLADNDDVINSFCQTCSLFLLVLLRITTNDALIVVNVIVLVLMLATKPSYWTVVVYLSILSQDQQSCFRLSSLILSLSTTIFVVG